MWVVVNALVPILSLVLLGYALRRKAWLADGFWPAAEKLAYYGLLPSLLVVTLARADLSQFSWWHVGVAAILPLVAVAALLWLWFLSLYKGDGKSFTSLFQGGIRLNTFVGLALSEALLGSEGLTIAALVAGFMISTVNLLCIFTFALATESMVLTVKKLLYQVFANPLVLACLAGGLLNTSGIGLPSPFYETLQVFSRAALPIALLAVGAALQMRMLTHAFQLSAIGLLCKFVLLPLLGVVSTTIMGIDDAIATVIVVFMALPTAPSAYILAVQLGGDRQLMASMITQQTIIAFLTLPVTLWLLERF